MSYDVYDSRGFRGQVASNHGLGLLYDYLEGKGVDDLVDDGSAELDGDFLARLDKVPAPKDKAVASTLARLKELAHDCRDVVIISDGVGIDEEAEKALKPDYADALRKRLEGALAADMETALKKAFALLKERVMVEARYEGVKGGPGSGHFGHAGRIGQVGGGVPDSERRGRMAKFPTVRVRPEVTVRNNNGPARRAGGDFTVEKVKKRLEKIPNHHIAGLDSVEVDSDYIDAYEKRTGRKQGSVAGVYTRDENRIRLRNYADDSLEHEVGHHVHYRYYAETGPTNHRAYEAALKRGHGISSYGMTNEREYFAEWYETYSRNRTRSGEGGANARANLQALDPQMYVLMKELWHDK